MIILKTNPKGIDQAIQLLQSELESELVALWQIQADSFVFYPRAYRNSDPNGSGFIAEHYKGEGEYEEVYWNDNLNGTAFFYESTKTTVENGQNETEVALIVFANVKTIKPLVAHRADQEIRLDFQRILGRGLYGFGLLSIETGLAQVLREFPGSRRDRRLDAADMGEVHAFRFNLSLRYDPELCSWS